MSALRSPGIYIVMMSLITTGILAWTSIAAPCIEIGFFWASTGTALIVALYAWLHADRISHAMMVMIYCQLACAISLAVTSVVDLANFSLLGERFDGETGLLLGGVVSFITVATIATRNSERFPKSLSWGSFVALLTAWSCYSIFNDGLQPEFGYIISSASIFSTLIAFVLLSRCKFCLSDNQYLSVLVTISLFICFCTPSAKDSFAASLADNALVFMFGMLFFVERKADSATSRVAGTMLLYLGFTDVLHDILFHGLAINEILAGIPALFCSLLIVFWLQIRRIEMPRGLYWASLFIFGLFGIVSVIPESYSDPLTLPILGSMVLFALACVWYASFPIEVTPVTWRERFRFTFVTSGYVSAFAIMAFWFTFSLGMLIFNAGPSRMIALLNNTPLWPGDAAFVHLAMREESLWPEGVWTLNPGDGEPVDDYLQRIRPNNDRFSKVVGTSSYEQRDQGVSDESIGMRWVAAKSSFQLLKVNSKSPAGLVGLVRGDRIVAINGIKVKDIKDDDTWDRLFGKWEVGTKLSMNVMAMSGKKRNVSLAIGNAVQDPPMSKIITTPKGKVGYLYLEGFNEAQFRQITHHFVLFKKEGIHDLVLDFRYNSGGRVENASKLADLIAGDALEGEIFLQVLHTPRLEDRDADYLFERLPESLSINRLVVITTDETCSASESVIIGLRPFLKVTTVGSTTCGKPFVMQAIEFGDKTLMPVIARVQNSQGEGDYTKGIRPDIKAEDDLTHQLGDPEEEMLKKALEVI